MGQEIQLDQVWINSRNNSAYQVLGLPTWSDTPGAEKLEDLEKWVFLKNLETSETYVRSQESFLGTNRHGEARFVLRA